MMTFTFSLYCLQLCIFEVRVVLGSVLGSHAVLTVPFNGTQE
jgi:hypothetical protein